MWFYLFRFIILILIAILVLLCLRLIQRLRQRKTWEKIIGFVAIEIVLWVILQYPFENLFFHFKTPEEAFTYSHFGATVQTMVEEDSCAFIVYSTGIPSVKIDAIEKGDHGWNINHPRSKHRDGYKPWYSTDLLGNATSYSLKMVQSNQSNQLFVVIQHYDFNGSSHKVSDVYDTLDSSYQSYVQNDLNGWYIEYHYTVLDMARLDDDYQIYVEGKPIDPFKDLYEDEIG